MTTGNEKRRHIRHPLSGIVAVTARDDGENSDPFEVSVFDVSAGGAGFSSEKKLNIGDSVTFTFSLPGSNDKKIGLHGRVARSEQAVGSSGEVVNKYGLRISNFITGHEEAGDLRGDRPGVANYGELILSLPDADIKWLRDRADSEGKTVSEVVSSLISLKDE